VLTRPDSEGSAISAEWGGALPEKSFES